VKGLLKLAIGMLSTWKRKTGKQLYYANRNTNNYFSPGAPIYWPADPIKLPDLIDFAITKTISQSMMYNVQTNMFVPIQAF